MDQRKSLAFRWAAVLTIVASILYTSWPLGFWLNAAAMHSGLASELGAVGQPYNWLFDWLDIVSGAFLVVAVSLLIKYFKLKRWAKWTAILMAVYGICGALSAALPMQCVPSQKTCGPVLSDPMLILHGAAGFIGAAALIGTLVTGWAYASRHSPTWKPWIILVGWGGTLFAVLSAIFYIWNGPGYWAQRYYITLSSIWVASIPFVLYTKRKAIRSLKRQNSLA